MTKDEKIIAHCLNTMMTTEQTRDLLQTFGCTANGNKSKIIETALTSCKQLNVKNLTSFLRQKWVPADIKIHFDNMKSGKLKGHNWHGAKPSFLHLSLQDKVRECAAGQMSIDELISIGADIMKHEYFMVAQHDILETSIIQHFTDSIPPISSKSITDFVFKGTPVDLKVSGFPADWEKRASTGKELTAKEKIKLINDLYTGADKERMRKQADGSIDNWGLNRMYIVIKNQDNWFTNPEKIVNDVIAKLEKTSKPYDVTVNNFDFEAFCIDV